MVAINRRLAQEMSGDKTKETEQTAEGDFSI